MIILYISKGIGVIMIISIYCMYIYECMYIYNILLEDTRLYVECLKNTDTKDLARDPFVIKDFIINNNIESLQ